MTPAQCRAARALLDWTQQELADVAGIGIVTIRQFESGVGLPRNATTEALMNRLESAGIEFLAGNGAGPGVRLKQETYTLGQFLVFLKVYEHNRLRTLTRARDIEPRFGYVFVYHNREGADLMYEGQRLGHVRWRNGAIAFDPPLPVGVEPTLSDEVFDRWVDCAEYRRDTGTRL